MDCLAPWGRVGISCRSHRHKRVLAKGPGMSKGLLLVSAGKRIDALICRRRCLVCGCRSPFPFPFRLPFRSHPIHNSPRCCVAAVVCFQTFLPCRQYCCYYCYCILFYSRSRLMLPGRRCFLRCLGDRGGLMIVVLPDYLGLGCCCCCCCCCLMPK